MLDTRTSELLLLRRDAGLLLAQLDGAATLDELVEDAADGSDADAVRAWLLATLDGLRDAGLLAGDP
ncbi:PqqD family peptide modification chaperone [Egicoccus halophilus]|uniref:PqqD family peptide modification chaperone n=1 Tax=Egicoccus halophilus TaxID=1670830 RepID=UPI00102FDCA7|nr:PqqD family peptide modification chaperone [Egicoccus halophilus]